MEAGTPDLIKLEDLDAAAGRLTGRKHVLSILVENRPGVLARIAGLFSRRGFNIDTLAVGPTDDPSISRITLTLDGAVHPIDQVTKQLHKLVNVIKIRDMEPGETIAREMALFKVSAPVESRAEIMQFAEIFRATIVDVSRRSLTIELTGCADKIEAFERMIRPHGLIEMVRTGEVAIARSQVGRVASPCPIAAATERAPRRRLERARSTARRGARAAGRSRARPSRSMPIDPDAVVLASRWPRTAGSAGSSPTTTASRSPRWAAFARSSRAGRSASPTSSATAPELLRDAVLVEPLGLARGRRPRLDGRFRLRSRRRPRAAVVVASSGADGPSRALAASRTAGARSSP